MLFKGWLSSNFYGKHIIFQSWCYIKLPDLLLENYMGKYFNSNSLLFFMFSRPLDSIPYQPLKPLS